MNKIIDVDWNTYPPDSQYYDIRTHTVLKMHNNIVYEWSESKKVWCWSSDYTSIVPLDEFMIVK